MVYILQDLIEEATGIYLLVDCRKKYPHSSFWKLEISPEF